jgi:hypothetical protein
MDLCALLILNARVNLIHQSAIQINYEKTIFKEAFSKNRIYALSFLFFFREKSVCGILRERLRSGGGKNRA